MPPAGDPGAALSEFAVIARYFTRPVAERQGVGDDCALIDLGDRTLALTADMLVEGTHFFADVAPAALGHKALAVNLSDLAAAGAAPRCFLLSLGLPRAEPAWLQDFAQGLFALADRHGCALVGGDTTRVAPAAAVVGPHVVAITAIGEVPRAALRTRAGARPGDDVWVSGALGDAALAVAARTRDPVSLGLSRGAAWPDDAAARERLDWPEPRVALGLALRGLATAAIDVSDGLVGDLGHVLARSGVGARIDADAVPCRALFENLPATARYALVLAGGDDYELLFTAAPADRAAVRAAGNAADVAVTRIGAITAAPGLSLVDRSGAALDLVLRGYDHFAAAAASTGTAAGADRTVRAR